MAGNPDRKSDQFNETLGKYFTKKLKIMKDLIHSHESNTQKKKKSVKWMLLIFYVFLMSQLLKKISYYCNLNSI